ncbi:MAG: hypothetical protein GF418_01680 [Chitinivibrionales bacterium]|nr:hypothetical protein [Chitinivibrionales bacterium]MBD3394312.1 hypothetical protein [Chitinivibrionales bacterium]
MRNLSCMLGVLLVLAVASVCRADEGVVGIRASGMVSYSILQLVKAGGKNVEYRYFTAPSTAFERAWVHTVEGELGIAARVNRRLLLDIGYRAHIANLPWEGGEFGNQREFTNSGLTRAKAVVSLGDIDNPAVVVTGGIFPFTYNSDAKDLGEYLLMSGCYPGYVYSGFESFKLAGIHVHHRAAEIYAHDLLVTSEIVQVPYWDFSLSYLGELRAADPLTVGAGVMFYRLLPVKPDNTTPESPATTPGGDEVQLTLRGVKAMVRASFDIKKIVPMPLLGEHDLKLYAEAAVLGVKDYEYFYPDITERIPVMAGFNVPAFGLLDYISAEVEWYGSPHDNNPIPEVKAYMVGHPDRGHGDDVKWAVSLQRSLGDNVKIQGRAASDHLRFDDGLGTTEVYEWIVAPDQWYWSLKGIFVF